MSIKHFQHDPLMIILTWPLAVLKWILHTQMSFVRGCTHLQIQNTAVFGFSTRLKSIGFWTPYPLSLSQSFCVCLSLTHTLSSFSLSIFLNPPRHPPSPPDWRQSRHAGSVPWEGLSTADNGPFHSFWLPFICSHQHQSLSVPSVGERGFKSLTDLPCSLVALPW